MDRQLLEKFQLGQYYDQIAAVEKPAIAYKLLQPAGAPAARSRLGGIPLVPPGFTWPRCSKRELDFLLQIDLAETAPLDQHHLLPDTGLLTVFYDLENQPWGYDPSEPDGFRVAYFPEQPFQAAVLPKTMLKLPERSVTFNCIMTIPNGCTRPYDRLVEQCHWTRAEIDKYFKFMDAYNEQYYRSRQSVHRLLGHPLNIQNDMQLEVQLVSNGLYCGNRIGFEDPRAKELEPGEDDWLLLLQVDTDDDSGLMWGDCGMLYFWIHSADLANRRFEKTWMILQCG